MCSNLSWVTTCLAFHFIHSPYLLINHANTGSLVFPWAVTASMWLQCQTCNTLPSFLSFVHRVIINSWLIAFELWTCNWLLSSTLHFLAKLEPGFIFHDWQSHNKTINGFTKNDHLNWMLQVTLTFRGCIFPCSEEWRPTCWNREGLYWCFSNAFCSLQCF